MFRLVQKLKNRAFLLNVCNIALKSFEISEKKEEIWLSLMTKTPTPTKKSKKQRDNTKMAPKTVNTPRLPTDIEYIFVLDTWLDMSRLLIEEGVRNFTTRRIQVSAIVDVRISTFQMSFVHDLYLELSVQFCFM